MEVCLNSRPDNFTTGENAYGAHCIGGRVDTVAGLDVVAKKKESLYLPRIEPHSSSP
jgi:hypothetical protein